jgi:hypothetical protein
MTGPCIELDFNSVGVLLMFNLLIIFALYLIFFFDDHNLNGQIKTPPHALSSINSAIALQFQF